MTGKQTSIFLVRILIFWGSARGQDYLDPRYFDWCGKRKNMWNMILGVLCSFYSKSFRAAFFVCDWNSCLTLAYTLCLSQATAIAPSLPIPQQYPSSSMRPSGRERGAGLHRLRTNKTVCQATLTLHPYRLSDLRHFMSRSCLPPQTPNNKKRHALCTAASPAPLFTRHRYHLTACTLPKVTFWTSIYHILLYDIYT